MQDDFSAEYAWFSHQSASYHQTIVLRLGCCKILLHSWLSQHSSIGITNSKRPHTAVYDGWSELMFGRKFWKSFKDFDTQRERISYKLMKQENPEICVFVSLSFFCSEADNDEKTQTTREAIPKIVERLGKWEAIECQPIAKLSMILNPLNFVFFRKNWRRRHTVN